MTDMPQCQSPVGQAHHSRVGAEHGRVRAMLLSAIEPSPLFQILQSPRDVPQPEQGHAKGAVSFDEQTRILDAHRHLEKLLAGLACGLQLAPNMIEPIQPMQSGEELRWRFA